MSIDGAPGDQLLPIVRQRRRFQAMLADFSHDDWSTASRCDGWTVQDVVAHLVGTNAFWHASVLAGLAGAPTRVLAGFDPVTTPALMVAAMRDLSPADVLDQFVASNDAFLAGIGQLDNHGWAALAESPAGHIPIRVMAHHALWDCWVHERDIALPLGLHPPAEVDEVRSSLRFVAALSPAFALNSGQQFTGVFAVETSAPSVCFVLDIGESVAVRDDVIPRDAPCLRGEAVALVEALSFRSPLPASTPTAWLELVEGLASVFDADRRSPE